VSGHSMWVKLMWIAQCSTCYHYYYNNYDNNYYNYYYNNDNYS